MTTILPALSLPRTRVLDLTRLLPGAVATQILGDFGATIVKVEHPGGGDPGRRFPTSRPGEFFAAVNRGKKSVAVNLREPDGRAAFLALLRTADIVIEGFRPGVMTRLAIDYASAVQVNEAVIYVSINGFGSTGAHVSVPAHDLNYCAMAGLLRPHQLFTPTVPLVQIADVLGGLHAVNGILLALLARNGSGKGRHIEVSLLHAANWLSPIVRATTRDGLLTGFFACYNLYQTQDGWISVGAVEAKFWEIICSRLGQPELSDQQFVRSRQKEIVAWLRDIFRANTSAYWSELLQDGCVIPVADAATVAQASSLPIDGKKHATGEYPPFMANAAGSEAVPMLGEHTCDELMGAGLSRDYIDELAARKIVQLGQAADG